MERVIVKDNTMRKRVVVLGGVGLIGTHLCLRLLREGAEVFCVDIRDMNDSPLLIEARQWDGFHYIHHNITHSFGIRCDEIYNLASPSHVRYDKALPVETLKVNVAGSVNTLETARAEHAKVLFASSSEIYGVSQRYESLGESRYYSTISTILGEAKRSAEAFHRAYKIEYGTDTRIARIFNAYGTSVDVADRRVIMRMIVAALLNRDITIYGNGEQSRTFCWVEDIVDGIVRLMAAEPNDTTPTVNFGSTHEITMKALSEKIISLTGSRSQIVHAEPRFNDPQSKMPDTTVAHKQLGWAPTVTLDEGLRRTINYAEKELTKVGYTTRSWVEMH